MTKSTKKTRAKGQTRRPQEQGGNEAIAAPADAEAAAEARQAAAEPEQATEPTSVASAGPLNQDGGEATTAAEADTAAKAKPAPEPKKERAPAKKDRLVELLRRENGATIEELMAELGWQGHTVRGAISIAAKRLGVTAEQVEKGRYRLPG